MRPSLLLSLLLFIRLISTTPISGFPLDHRCFTSCRDGHIARPKPRNSSSDQDLPLINTYLSSVASTPQAKGIVEELVSSQYRDSSSQIVSSSESTYTQSVIYVTAQYPGQDWNKSSQEDSQVNRITNGYSERLVVSIVILFLIVLIAWETLGG